MSKKEYAARNAQWLIDKAAEPGVNPIGGGVLCRVMASGKADAPQPNRGSVVVVRYSGRTVDGHVFDSSDTHPVAPALRLRDLIEGWVIALTQMRVGDKWEIYIPADKGYGKRSQPGIPGNSTLVFVIELLGVG